MGSISLWHGDICELEVDAIVNPASTSLWMATGVAGAIKRRGGDAIEFEAVRQAPCPLGSAVVTGAGTLPCQYVIHAVSLGPDRRASAASIESATRAALAEAARLRVRTIAFPALGTGVGGFPLEEAARVMVRAVREELARNPDVEQVVFALKGQAPYLAFEAELAAPADRHVQAEAPQPSDHATGTDAARSPADAGATSSRESDSRARSSASHPAGVEARAPRGAGPASFAASAAAPGPQATSPRPGRVSVHAGRRATVEGASR